MRTSQSLLLLLFLSFFAFDSSAQADEKRYVIQIATFGSWEEMVEHKEDFSPYMSAYAEKIGKRVKVYLLAWNGDWQSGMLFYPGKELESMSEFAKKNHKGAFRRSDVKMDNLILTWDAFEKYKKKETPTEYTAKGGSISTESNSSGYKIQLGAFSEQKSLEYIAEKYGLTEAEKGEVEELVTYDFKKIKKVICRRYFFGDFDSKTAATTKKKALEKKSKRKLLLVKS